MGKAQACGGSSVGVQGVVVNFATRKRAGSKVPEEGKVLEDRPVPLEFKESDAERRHCWKRLVP